MSRTRWKKSLALIGICCASALGLKAWPSSIPSARPRAAELVEEGTFRLHKFEQPIGEEKYTVRKEGDELQLSVSFQFNDRGQDVPLSAFLRMSQDLTPLSMEIHGDMARGTPIDGSVLAQKDKILTRTNADWRVSARPAQFFTIATYAPAAFQMMLIRKWQAAGRWKRLQAFPAGELGIEDRGPDEFVIQGTQVNLERFSITDLAWGRETLWLDAQGRLAALVTVDGEYDHFEAIRPEYEENLGDFVRRTASDEMAALAEISKSLRGDIQGTFALVGASLIDGTGAPVVKDSVVVIQGGRILAVGPRSKILVPRNVHVLDVTGKTIVPGLWDMHAHFEQVEWGPVYLAAGVTTVRDCGNEFEFITAVREAINSGHGVGPRLLLAGIVDGSGPVALGVARVDTPEQAREWVHRYHDAGFNQIKIYSSVKKENLEVVTAEAHKLGMTVTGHIPEGMTGFDGVNAGMDQINHITYIVRMMAPDISGGRGSGNAQEILNSLRHFDPDSEQSRKAIQFLKSHGTVVDPTLTLFEMFQRTGRKPLQSFEPGVAKVAPALSTQLRNVGPGTARAELGEARFAVSLKAVAALHRAGVPIVVGTDQSVPGHSVHREMELYMEAGFTPMEALQSATIVPAKAMGLDKETGTIEPGKRADLVILGANPLENIANIRRTEMVVQGGAVYDCAALWRSVGFQP